MRSDESINDISVPRGHRQVVHRRHEEVAHAFTFFNTNSRFVHLVGTSQICCSFLLLVIFANPEMHARYNVLCVTFLLKSDKQQ